ncbi:MAG: hypothetical protein JSR70_08560 [Proteobacteria bacterium]|nr:hypothetical protein [Pseudomonadota bacterium]
MKPEDGTHYRKVFDSPYLSSADIVEPTALTIARVTQETDKTKKTKDTFNTAYFHERELRPGEKLKPMILNATNSKLMAAITGSPYIEDWSGIRVIVYVDKAVKFGKDTVEGLRLRQAPSRRTLTPDQTQTWENAKAAFKKDGNLNAVLAKVDISDEHKAQLISECMESVE